MEVFRGIAASPGKAVGTAFRPHIPSQLQTERGTTTCNPETAAASFREAYVKVRAGLTARAKVSEVFAAHAELLEDLADRVLTRIEERQEDAARAIQATCEEVCALFADIDDDYLRARTDDILDVCRQLITQLTGDTENPFSGMPQGGVVVADNLLPSDTVLMDLSLVGGIVLKRGSPNSHLAILARDNAIPVVLGVGDKLDALSDGDVLLVDGDEGRLIKDPTSVLLQEVGGKRTIGIKSDPAPAVTQNGVEVSIYGNAGSVSDVERAIANGADGIGLLRTEFMFMQAAGFPDEEEQYRVYSACAELCGSRPLTIRTLDIGADKQLPYVSMAPEGNPALGLRGIRFSLAYPDIFTVQLRAVLRASAHGNIRLMFPMISSLEEYTRACALLETCKGELRQEGRSFSETLAPGIMIETPASVFLAEDLAKYAAFFSIGTNDLTQYILAVDRENPYTVNACDSFHPAVINGLKQVMSATAARGTEISICGEMASDPRGVPLLLNLGVRKLSVTGANVSRVKGQIREQTIYL